MFLLRVLLQAYSHILMEAAEYLKVKLLVIAYGAYEHFEEFFERGETQVMMAIEFMFELSHLLEVQSSVMQSMEHGLV